jgi:biotin transport system substrate-specific component
MYDSHAHARPQTNISNLASIFGCAAITAVTAQWAFHLPFTPVPVTWQVAAVLFAGLTLGARSAMASQVLYLSIGAAGAPVFALWSGGPAHLIGPTGGYLLSYPIAAWVTATLAGRAAPTPTRLLAACAAGLAVIYAMGASWLGITLHLPAAQALMLGAGWFLFWDTARAIIVVTIVQVARKRLAA